MSVAARLHGAHESTHDPAIHLRRDCVHVNVLARKKLAGVIHVVNAGWFKVDLLKSRSSELGAVVVLF
ncbi:MAG: hypothetical protein ABSE44_02985 [Candidatus Sulfotelmatobacter sp.]